MKSDILAVIATAQGNSSHPQQQWNPQQPSSVGFSYYPFHNVNPGPSPYPCHPMANHLVCNPIQRSYPQNPSKSVHQQNTNNTLPNHSQQTISKPTTEQQQPFSPNDCISPASSMMTNTETSDSEGLAEFLKW